MRIVFSLLIALSVSTASSANLVNRERLSEMPVQMLGDLQVQERLVTLFSSKGFFAEHREFFVDKMTDASGFSFWVFSATDHPMPMAEPVTYHFVVAPVIDAPGSYDVGAVRLGAWVENESDNCFEDL